MKNKRCYECRTLLFSKISLVNGKCVTCRNKTKRELERRIRWNEILNDTYELPEGKDKRKMILGIIKGRKSFLKSGTFGGSIEKEFDCLTPNELSGRN